MWEERTKMIDAELEQVGRKNRFPRLDDSHLDVGDLPSIRTVALVAACVIKARQSGQARKLGLPELTLRLKCVFVRG